YLGRKQPKTCVWVSAVGRERNFAKVSGRLKNSFDKDAVAKEIDLQREVTQAFGKTSPKSQRPLPTNLAIPEVTDGIR
ncbi:TPA: hypothetical protein ACJ3G8_002076, partial [Neisseria meningitidis]